MKPNVVLVDLVQLEINMNVEHTLWVERYRPTTLDTFVGNGHFKDIVKSIIDNNDVPNLLLYGDSGSGKTTIAKIIANNTDSEFMYINASDERNVDTVRDKIKSFASTIAFRRWKLVILDEADFMTTTSQAMLRNIMETYSSTCRFILTCNYIDRIIKPLQSRCQSYNIVPPSKREVALHVYNILQQEGISAELTDLASVVDASYPDIRKIIHTCQLNSRDGKMVLDTLTFSKRDYMSDIVNILVSRTDKKNKFTQIRQTIADSGVKDFTDLYTYLYSNIDTFASTKVGASILILSDGMYKSNFVVDKEINIMATLIQLIDLI